MYRIEIEIEGTSPLRHNKLTEAIKDTIRVPTTGKRKRDEELIKEAELGIYRDDEGEICVEAKALKKCGLNGAGRVKISRRSLSQDFNGAVIFESRFIPLFDDNRKRYKKPTGFHSDFVKRPPKRGVLVPSMWAYFHPWILRTTALVADDRIPLEAIKEAFVNGGLLFGLLDGRPEWGRFIVKEVKRI